MPGSFSTYAANAILNHSTGRSSWTMPANVYLAAFTATPSDSGGGTECTGGSYARKQLTPASDFSAATSRGITNANAIEFVTATGSWGGNVVAVAAFDAATSGNMLWWDGITSTAVSSGTTLRIPAGELEITIVAGT